MSEIVTHEDVIELSKKLREAREYAGFTTKELAQVFKISENEVIEFEALFMKENIGSPLSF